MLVLQRGPMRDLSQHFSDASAADQAKFGKSVKELILVRLDGGAVVAQRERVDEIAVEDGIAQRISCRPLTIWIITARVVRRSRWHISRRRGLRRNKGECLHVHAKS